MPLLSLRCGRERRLFLITRPHFSLLLRSLLLLGGLFLYAPFLFTMFNVLSFSLSFIWLVKRQQIFYLALVVEKAFRSLYVFSLLAGRISLVSGKRRRYNVTLGGVRMVYRALRCILHLQIGRSLQSLTMLVSILDSFLLRR